MKKFAIAGISGVTLLAAISYVLMLPPLCFYAGESGEACLNRLRQIDAAKQQWSLETGHALGPVSAAELEKLFFNGHTMVCPSGGAYSYGNLGEDPVCSLATNAAPPAMKERVGVLGWRWKVWPSLGPRSHKLPK